MSGVSAELMTLKSPLGVLSVSADAGVLRGIRFTSTDFGRRPAAPALQVLADRLQAYFSGDLHALDTISVDPEGTPFQRDVWRMLQQIPIGQTWSYADLARAVGRPDAVRAVGAANGANPIPIVIPCHRVIGTDGRLVGYGGGLERKRWLLEHEGVQLVEALGTWQQALKTQGVMPSA
jgi:methylated-DNA-[protein]-cysteine S-methyltransferase